MDSSPRGSNAGTCVNSPTYVTGRIGAGALSFNGSSTFVNIPNSASIDLTGNAVTLSAWINSGGVQNAYAMIGRKGGFTGYYLSFDPTGTKMRCGIPPINDGFNGNITIPINVWTQVACTYDGSKIKIYVNGTVDNSFTVSGSMTDSSSSALLIGQDPGGGARVFNGIIDDVRVYNRALSASDVAMLYQYGTVIFNNSTLRNLKTY